MTVSRSRIATFAYLMLALAFAGLIAWEFHRAAAARVAPPKVTVHS